MLVIHLYLINNGIEVVILIYHVSYYHSSKFSHSICCIIECITQGFYNVKSTTRLCVHENQPCVCIFWHSVIPTSCTTSFLMILHSFPSFPPNHIGMANGTVGLLGRPCVQITSHWIISLASNYEFKCSTCHSYDASVCEHKMQNSHQLQFYDWTSIGVLPLLANIYDWPCKCSSCRITQKYQELKKLLYIIRESVDSLCRDGADLPRAPYIGKACTRLNGESLSLFRGLTMVLK